jgi:hypothetical protein
MHSFICTIWVFSPLHIDLTFTQGFMLGQISFLAIILLFMRYVVFSPADKGDEQGWKRRRQEREQVCIAGQICPTVHAQYHYGQR